MSFLYEKLYLLEWKQRKRVEIIINVKFLGKTFSNKLGAQSERTLFKTIFGSVCV